jgi:hypothetical protein
VRISILQPLTVSPAAPWAPALIAIGFVVLLAGAWWSVVPVVTAMAVIALGATGVTANRRHTSPAFCVVIAVHLFVYLSLYFLFVGAVCHAAIQAPPGGLTFLQGLDLAVSVVPMALVVRRSLAAMGGDAPAC